MNGTPSVRRFVCGACGHVHAAWAPRCASCFAHGLNAVSTDVPVSLEASPTAMAVQSAPQELRPEPSRPRLMIARAPSPEPELSPEELADVLEDELVPLSDVEETTFVRDSTNLPPLDHVLGGGLVVASVVLLASPPGIGKCLGRGTPVIMFDGRVLPVEQILPGDCLMGPDGKARVVLTTNEGVGELFCVDPVKGEPWICNDVHVLTLVNSVTDEVLDVPLNEWRAKAPHSDLRHYGKLFSVGVDHFGRAEVKLPVDPYFLGLWFGDGTKALLEGQLQKIQISKPDPEVRQTCEEIARTWELQVSTHDEHRCSRL